ncbi:hypothetical protein S40293_09351 [Stachybotrys chartarum IBT 40293]|nr:hypothetical protein S40293_09351 [Stachybotrys chartarum IBT 40293]
MSRYERVNAQDDDDYDTPVNSLAPQPIPSSPPPSFHSRSSSPQSRVNPDLADAFDDDGSDDDEVDDRQRLVRQNSTPSDHPAASYPAAPTASTPQPSTGSGSRRVMGGGNGTDGVFANMSARPERTQADTEKEELPPTYEQAAADAAPPYWETTILAPGLGGLDEVYVDGMPVGSAFSFIWNGMISASFQLVGFLLTYLLHSTHAAKNGSRAGLGITMIQYGFYMKAASDDSGPSMGGPDGYAAPPDPNSHNFKAGEVAEGGSSDGDAITASEWLAYLLMIVGWFILIRSVAEFMKARRHEQLVLQSPERGLGMAIVADGESSERVV